MSRTPRLGSSDEAGRSGRSRKGRVDLESPLRSPKAQTARPKRMVRSRLSRLQPRTGRKGRAGLSFMTFWRNCCLSPARVAPNGQALLFRGNRGREGGEMTPYPGRFLTFPVNEMRGYARRNRPSCGGGTNAAARKACGEKCGISPGGYGPGGRVMPMTCSEKGPFPLCFGPVFAHPVRRRYRGGWRSA